MGTDMVLREGKGRFLTRTGEGHEDSDGTL
jgi:hypothetical protein